MTGMMFVPFKLELEGRPDLEVFPHNILFAQIGSRSGERVVGSALYEPDLSSLEDKESLRHMTYKNMYGGDSSVRITYNSETRAWQGSKTVNGKFAGMATGGTWQMFFTHLTRLGLTAGEPCIFRDFIE
jgi:hypothetical protein